MVTHAQMVGCHDHRLVTLSVVIAILASYTALDLGGRVAATRGRSRLAWLIGGAIAMGMGIWSMHYTGMLAFTLPIPVMYDVPTVLLSLLAAIFASGVALLVVSRPRMTVRHTLAGSAFMGAGIATMHYTGMAAMRLQAVANYDPRLVALSVVLAVVISLVALWLTFSFRTDTRPWGWRKILTSLLMGGAIPVMHYTAMAAVSFRMSPTAPNLSYAVDISAVANVGIILITVLVLAVTLLTALIDRRFSAQAQQLSHVEQRYQMLFQSSPQPAFVVDRETLAFLAVNEAALRTYGFSTEEFLDSTIHRILPDNLCDAPDSLAAHSQHRKKDGTPFDVEVSVRKITWGDKRATLVLANDVTERNRAIRFESDLRTFLAVVAQNEPQHSSLRQLTETVANQAPGGICCVLMFNGKRCCAAVASRDDAQFPLALEGCEIPPECQDILLCSAVRQVDLESLASFAGAVFVEWAAMQKMHGCWCSPIVSSDGANLGAVLLLMPEGIQLDPKYQRCLEMASRMASIAVEHRQLTEKLAHQAQHDALTGLPNRILLQDRLQQAIAYANRHGRGVAVLTVDLDGFKYFNDTFGHHAGDKLLAEVARRLSAVTRKTDTVSRVGGDEFVIVLTELKVRHDSIPIAQKCLDIIRRPVSIGDGEYALSASIGISCYPEDATELDLLLQHADAAMYEAKFHGKNAIQVFTPEISAHAGERLGLINDLRGALEAKQLVLHYQPQFSSEGDLAGFEALLRWQHPRLGLIPPNRFIPLAEETGLIVPIGNWVLREACGQLAGWRQAGFKSLRVAVNVSTMQLQRDDWTDVVERVLEETGIPPSFLELEITESLVMRKTDAVIERLARLRKIGVSLAIDDFGTGYSSLKYLQRLPIDALKIDRAFVQDLSTAVHDRPGSTAIVRAIAGLGQKLGLRIVAEGVETEEQARVLRELGCDLMQGFWFSKPISADDCGHLLLARGARRLVRKSEPTRKLRTPGDTRVATKVGVPHPLGVPCERGE